MCSAIFLQDIKQYTFVTFVLALLLSSNTQLFEELEISLSPELLQRFKDIDPHFNPKACLQEFSDLGASAVTDLALKQAWRYVEVTKENESLCSRKEAFEGLLKEEKVKGEGLLADVADMEQRTVEYRQKISTLEKELQSAKNTLKYKQNGAEEDRGPGRNDGSVLKWKRIAEEWQSKLTEIELRHNEEVDSLERTMEDLRKQLEKKETGCQQSHTVNSEWFVVS